MFSRVYVEAFETILFIEKVFGTQLREYAVRISKESYGLRTETVGNGFQTAADVNRK